MFWQMAAAPQRFPRRIRELTAVSAGGHDLNGDGDTLDTVRVYAPSNTNTRRYGLLTSLVGKIDDDNAVQLAYSLDWGLHRQTGQNAFLNVNNSPNSVFGGLVSDFVSFADGTNIRSRDRRVQSNPQSGEHRL